jgi:hypothetical protein
MISVHAINNIIHETSFGQPALTQPEFLDRIATFMHVRDAQIQLPLNESWIEWYHIVRKKY